MSTTSPAWTTAFTAQPPLWNTTVIRHAALKPAVAVLSRTELIAVSQVKTVIKKFEGNLVVGHSEHRFGQLSFIVQ